ncbi:MAG: CHAP domain-containing protein [Lentimicrobiaceae bacterium]|nr:CHAP domain-containing protein [Lentimicrobiaceae bacterium]
MKLKIKRWISFLIGLLFLGFVGLLTLKKCNICSTYTVGQKIDSLNGVFVFYNGKISNVSGQDLTKDGYNLGQKYQCVEFVKRYYYEYLQHKMPESYGHAKDFFDKTLIDGQKNKTRDLTQYTNLSQTKPQVDDLVVFDGRAYGHVAIISKVTKNKIEIIQQNSGRFGKSRNTFSLYKIDGKWKIKNKRILGWLRKE